MKFTFDGVDYDVYYEHGAGQHRFITCYIARGEGPPIVYTAVCKHAAGFSYRIGREIARGRALKRLFPQAADHPQRREFESAYRHTIALIQVRQRRSAERKLYETLKTKYERKEA